MNYREAYDYLNSFTNYENVPGITYALNMDGLTRVDVLMRLLGMPQDDFGSIVIAGTKGKGSVAAMIESALRNAGHVTGLYTSPHLHTFRERIRVNGEMISPQDVARLTEQLQPTVEKIKALGEPSLVPTTYELATALAFLYFKDRGVTLAVLEVGLGGRLDAVNITRPLVSVITPISLDHTQVLGDTVGQIAEEKAGIIKHSGRVISAPQPADAMSAILRIATGQKAHVDVVSRDIYISTHHLPEVVSDEQGVPIYQVFSVAFESSERESGGRVRIQLPLLGAHQQVNAAVAFAALRSLGNSGIEIQHQAIIKGFAEVKWPGRLEIIHRDPTVVVDGAHNVDSMSKLNQAMYDLFYGHNLVVILGMSTDKDIKGILQELGPSAGNVFGPKVERLIVTRSHHPRSAPPELVADLARERGMSVEVVDNVSDAIEAAIEVFKSEGDGTANNPPIVLVTGSLFVVAEAREHYGLAPDLSEEEY